MRFKLGFKKIEVDNIGFDLLFQKYEILPDKKH